MNGIRLRNAYLFMIFGDFGDERGFAPNRLTYFFFFRYGSTPPCKYFFPLGPASGCICLMRATIRFIITVTGIQFCAQFGRNVNFGKF